MKEVFNAEERDIDDWTYLLYGVDSRFDIAKVRQPAGPQLAMIAWSGRIQKLLLIFHWIRLNQPIHSSIDPSHVFSTDKSAATTPLLPPFYRENSANMCKEKQEINAQQA